MHICSIITSFTTGGAENLVCNLSREFAARGHRASVLALCNAATLGNPQEAEERMMNELRECGIHASSLALNRRRSFLKGRRALADALRKDMPDVIHAHTARSAPMAGLAAGAVPLVLTHHNSRLSFPPHLFRLFDRFVAAYVGISAACADQTRRFVQRPVHLIVNGAETAEMTVQPRASAGRNPAIIAVGAISDQKDYPTLLAAAKRLIPMLPKENLTVQIVGGGAGLNALQSIIEAERLAPAVQLLGVRSDVPKLLRSADLFVNSSLYEGMSVAMIEAMVAGLPIVATDVAGNCELVRHGENGILVPSADPEALAAGIARVLLDAPMYRRMSSAALASAKLYSIHACASAHLQLYEDVVSERGAARQAA